MGSMSTVPLCQGNLPSKLLSKAPDSRLDNKDFDVLPYPVAHTVSTDRRTSIEPGGTGTSVNVTHHDRPTGVHKFSMMFESIF
jgi:hypothetical protein